jgi:hypothetical protein
LGGSVHYQFTLTPAQLKAPVDAPLAAARSTTFAALNPTTLSGPFELHNDRNNFSNTNTLMPAPCVPVPLLAGQAAPAGQNDPAGNSAQ